MEWTASINHDNFFIRDFEMYLTPLVKMITKFWTAFLFQLHSKIVDGSVLYSNTREYHICSKMPGGYSPSDVYVAVLTENNVTHTDRDALCKTRDRKHPSLVVVKCEKPNPDGETLRNEINMATSLSGIPWAVSMIEPFNRTREGSSAGDRCYAMRMLGHSLREIREKSKTDFDLKILASIGLQMITILDDMHNRLGLYHSDVHAANWLVRVDDPGQLSLIDYGYTKPIKAAPDAIKDLQEMIITLRWFIDLKMEWYVPKKIRRLCGGIDIDKICAHVPPQLRAIVEHVMSFTPETFNFATEYEMIRNMFISMGAEERIPWHDEGHLKLVRWL